MTNLRTRTHRSLFAAALMLSATLSFAQVKIGTNPTTITPNTNLDVEGNNNTHMVVMKPGLVGINTAAPAYTLEVQAVADNSVQWANNIIAHYIPFGGTGVTKRAAIMINDRTAIGFDVDPQQYKYSFMRGNAANDLRLQVTSNAGILHQNAFVMSGQDGRTSFIGLGTEAPQARLDVRGDLKVLATYGTQTGEINAGTSTISGFEAMAGGGVSYIAVQSNGASANLFLTKPAGSAGAGAVFQRFSIGGNSVGSISYNGSGGILFTNTSDQRLKENIRTTKFGLQALKTVKVYDYNFKTDKHKTLSTGVLAQELHKVYPQAVSVGGTDAGKDPWQVDYSKLVPMLVKSVQELSAELESTNQKVASLENEKAKLSAELKRNKAVNTEFDARVSKVERMLNGEKPAEFKSNSR